MKSTDLKLKRTILIKKIKNLIYELFHNDYIILSSSVSPFFRNWGDDVNAVLPHLINPSIRIIQRKYSFNIKKRKDVLCIGSIISWMTTPNSVIWGSGIQFPEDEILYHGKVVKPSKVLAVRGSLTREYLRKKGIECLKSMAIRHFYFRDITTQQSKKSTNVGLFPISRINKVLWFKI